MRYFYPGIVFIMALGLSQQGLAEQAMVKQKTLYKDCEGRAPNIELPEAIKLATAALALMDSPNQHYIDTATLSCRQKKWFWQIGFRNRQQETGQIVFTIDMQAKVQANVRKDG